jgi:hypothetical protein
VLNDSVPHDIQTTDENDDYDTVTSFLDLMSFRNVQEYRKEYVASGKTMMDFMETEEAEKLIYGLMRNDPSIPVLIAYYEWYREQCKAQQDVTLFVGSPSSGKSWIPPFVPSLESVGENVNDEEEEEDDPEMPPLLSFGYSFTLNEFNPNHFTNNSIVP